MTSQTASGEAAKSSYVITAADRRLLSLVAIRALVVGLVLEAMDVSVDSLTQDVHRLKPDIKVIPTSCQTGAGIDQVVETLLST